MTITATDAYSSFMVTDLESSRAFYRDVLGLRVQDHDGMLTIHLPGGAEAVAYASARHKPAQFTILNFVVPDLPIAVSEFTRRGLIFERYEGTPIETDPDGIYRANGPWFAWFTDPSGNVLALREREIRPERGRTRDLNAVPSAASTPARKDQP